VVDLSPVRSAREGEAQDGLIVRAPKMSDSDVEEGVEVVKDEEEEEEEEQLEEHFDPSQLVEVNHEENLLDIKEEWEDDLPRMGLLERALTANKRPALNPRGEVSKRSH